MAGRKSKKAVSDEMMAVGGRVPPQAVDIEKYVLGAILLDPEAIAVALEHIDETAFYREAHRKIFHAMMKLFSKDEPIDFISVVNELKKREELDDVGGAAYITELTNMVASSANIKHHLNIIKEKALLRRLIHSCTGILTEAYDPNAEAEAVMSKAQNEVFDLLHNQKERSFQDIGVIVNETIGEIERLHHLDHTGIIGVPSGFRELDNMTAGFQKSDLVILAGRPSMGKTAFALNLARNAALEGGYGVGIFSLEMSNMQLVQRMLCREALVESHKLRTGKLNEKEWNRLLRNAGKLYEAPIYIDDTAGLDIIKLSSRARRMKMEKDVGLIVVDYLQLMDGPKEIDNRQQEISYISRSLKMLAKQLNIPIIALSQLSRAVEARPDKRPMLSDLRESGAIEQDADIVMFVYREEFYLKDHEDPHFKEVENICEIIIGKHRNGPIGTVKLTFLKQFGKFSDFAPDLDEMPPPTQDVAF
jgi:replicative DNA helicase